MLILQCLLRIPQTRCENEVRFWNNDELHLFFFSFVVIYGYLLQHPHYLLKSPMKIPMKSHVFFLIFSARTMAVILSPNSGWFKAQFAGRLAKKQYLCLCHGSGVAPQLQGGDHETIWNRWDVVMFFRISHRIHKHLYGCVFSNRWT